MFKKKAPKNVFTSIVPLYFFLKFSGLFPASFVDDFHHGKFTKRLSDKIYFYCVLIIWIIILIYELIRPISSEENNTSAILLRAWDFTTSCGVIAVVIAMPYQYLNIDGIMSICLSLNRFDEKVSVETS
jgi:hypothetical protein